MTTYDKLAQSLDVTEAYDDEDELEKFIKVLLVEKSVQKSPKWREELAKEGLIALVFRGHDTEVATNGPSTDEPGEPPYMVLCLAKESAIYPIGDYDAGFPAKELFLELLTPWEWADEERKEILLKESNILLNVADYFKDGPTDVDQTVNGAKLIGTTDQVDGQRLVAISSGESPKDIGLIRGEGALFISANLWGDPKAWQFRDISEAAKE
ncbi:hypothetical protein B0T10DRAFT_465887 [Thelonectria olida]|uniref:Uncharacterized protein n=1 Tax=Thelonectria olida TaxID=1576542 RepID=A0A9P9AJJ9_9HYPO|nr:hypothetical protein B0T10DRAFT_465887 [Thelonectria olida]